MKLLQQSLNSFFNLFLDCNCPMCGRSTPEKLCVYCTRSLDTCRLTNSTIRSQEDYPVVVWGAYRGTLKRAISTMKYNNHPEIGEPLGYRLGEAWLEYSASLGQSSHQLSNQSLHRDCMVIPIPLHVEKQKQRGFNQAELIAKGFCEVTQMKLVANGLVRIRETEAQHSLNKSDRALNLANVFQVAKSLQSQASRPIILVDDIYTTGATIASAIQTLTQNRQQVIGVVAAATPAQESLINI